MRRPDACITMLVLAMLATAALGVAPEGGLPTWSALQAEGRLAGGALQPVGPEGWQALRVSNEPSMPTRFPLVMLEGFHPEAAAFAVEGQVKHHEVEGEAYLEMWVVFPDGSRYFSRTLAPSGPLGKITGSSPWRDFSLPFTLNNPLPERLDLEIKLFMPGAGIIDVSPLRLAGLSAVATASQDAWWSDGGGGWIGAILGSGLGLIGGLLGWLMRRGDASRLVYVLLAVVGLVGLGCLAAAALALACSQPYAVYYPLGLVGVVGCLAAASMAVHLRRRQREVELRRMQALDAR